GTIPHEGRGPGRRVDRFVKSRGPGGRREAIPGPSRATRGADPAVGLRRAPTPIAPGRWPPPPGPDRLSSTRDRNRVEDHRIPERLPNGPHHPSGAAPPVRPGDRGPGPARDPAASALR